MPMLPFDFRSQTRVVFGEGTLSKVGEFARELGGRSVLVVTDPGVVRAGHSDRTVTMLRAAGLGVTVFDGVRENPDAHDVERCLAVARAAAADLLVGVGGGSAMDTAKGANFLLTNGGCIADYKGVGKAKLPMLPLIAVPTTAGTGSECQSFALISDPTTHLKMACGDPKAAAKIAILDPELTLSLPPRVTACTGMDAIVHALETAVTKKRSSLSQMFSREAFRLCFGAFEEVLQNPSNLDARGRMLLGAAFAGTAIENSMLGCAHSAANPLTAHLQVAHGEAVGRLIPGVVCRNMAIPDAASEYLTLARAAGLGSVAELLDRLVAMRGAASLDAPLSVPGNRAELVSVMAAEAAGQWTASFNPLAFSTSDFVALYQEVLS